MASKKPDGVKYRKIFLYGLVVIFLIVYYPVWENLITKWRVSEEYSHGFLVIPISLYLVWRNKEAIEQETVLPNFSGSIIFVIAVFVYVVSSVARIQTLASVSMIPLIAGAVIYLYGFRIFLIVWAPIAFLFFMIPIPTQIFSYLTIPLQLKVTQMSIAFVSLFDIPIFREGNLIQLPDKTFQVVQACSGLRSLISLLMLSFLFGYLSLNSFSLKLILFLIGIPVAIFVNIGRVILIILAYYYFKLDLTTGDAHTFIGIAIFIVALMLIMIARGALSRWDIEKI